MWLHDFCRDLNIPRLEYQLLPEHVLDFYVRGFPNRVSAYPNTPKERKTLGDLITDTARSFEFQRVCLIMHATQKGLTWTLVPVSSTAPSPTIDVQIQLPQPPTHIKLNLVVVSERTIL